MFCSPFYLILCFYQALNFSWPDTLQSCEIKLQDRFLKSHGVCDAWGPGTVRALARWQPWAHVLCSHVLVHVAVPGHWLLGVSKLWWKYLKMEKGFFRERHFANIVFLHLKFTFLPWTFSFSSSGVSVRQAQLSFRLCVENFKWRRWYTALIS